MMLPPDVPLPPTPLQPQHCTSKVQVVDYWPQGQGWQDHVNRNQGSSSGSYAPGQAEQGTWMGVHFRGVSPRSRNPYSYVPLLIALICCGPCKQMSLSPQGFQIKCSGLQPGPWETI